MHPSYVSVHPVALAMAAAQGVRTREAGNVVTADLYDSGGAINYLVRMGLFDYLGIDPGVVVTEHAATGRFIPLSLIRDAAALSEFMVQMIPMLHAAPSDAAAIKYVATEVVGNVIEHAASPVGALVCAQRFPSTNRISIGVADLGVGIRHTISRFHAATSDLDAIHLALRPGVTGASPRFGGNETNAGAGLFFTKSIAHTSRNLFVVYSGDAMFKLLRPKPPDQGMLLLDAQFDRATRETGLPAWPGTVIGIDFTVGQHAAFTGLLRLIRAAYDVDVKERRRARKRARFVS